MENKINFVESDINQLLLMTLHTDFYKKLIETHRAKSNKINKPLAQSLVEIVDLISNFLDTAEVVVEENESDCEKIFGSIVQPAINSSVLQLRSNLFCNACKHDVNKTLIPKLTQHFVNEKHVKSLKSYANDLENMLDDSPQVPASSDNDEGSTKSLDELETENHRTEKLNKNHSESPKKRNNSLPSRIKDVVPRGKLPKKMIDFLSHTDLEKYAMGELQVGTRVAEQRKHIRVCELLRRKISTKYPNVEIYHFGSFGIGLGDEHSDLDIFVDIDNCFYRKLPKRKMKDAIFNIQRILSNSPTDWGEFSPVTKARTPILRVFCRVEKIDCDLSFSNGLSTCNTSLVQYFITLQPLCKMLIIFIKNWSSLLNFGVNSYIWSLMVIFYLQQENALPSVKAIQDHAKPMFIEEWNVGFGTPTLNQMRMPYLTNFRQCLAGFFKFYGHQFDFTNYIICTLTGTRVPKHIFDHGKEASLPPVFQSYISYMNQIDVTEADEIDDLFANYKPLVIQDPFELIHNVGKGVPEQKLLKIIHFMRATLEVITNAKY